MPNALLVHGWGKRDEFYDDSHPTASNSHWLPWLSKQLMIRDIHTVAIEMPHSYYPEYVVWKRELERFDINEDTMLVGHSCGGGFLVRWLTEYSGKVGKLVLVAPWLGMGADPEMIDPTFFEFDIDSTLSSKTVRGLTIVSSRDDMDTVKQSIERLRSELDDCKIVELDGKGHFTYSSLGGPEFPELLKEIVG